MKYATRGMHDETNLGGVARCTRRVHHAGGRGLGPLGGDSVLAPHRRLVPVERGKGRAQVNSTRHTREVERIQYLSKHKFQYHRYPRGSFLFYSICVNVLLQAQLPYHPSSGLRRRGVGCGDSSASLRMEVEDEQRCNFCLHAVIIRGSRLSEKMSTLSEKMSRFSHVLRDDRAHPPISMQMISQR